MGKIQKKCIHCGEEFEIKVKSGGLQEGVKCPHCGKTQMNKIQSAILLLMIIGILCFIFIDFGEKEPVTQGYCTHQMKEMIKDQYKSPSTVKFINCKWKDNIIFGEADAQNGFGATVRSNFTCTKNKCAIFQR